VSIDSSTPGLTSITNTPNAVIEWQDFSIAHGETTRFIQQHSASAVLNRVVGANPSEVLGSLLSNGQVFVINPNGLVFGADSIVDTQGLVASTLNISNADFLSGNYHFVAGSETADLVNEGIIRAGQDGNIVLIAPNITNSGTLSTDGGMITLAAGSDLTLTSLDNPSIRFQVQAPENEVLNVGELLAQGGAVDLFAGSITHSGVIQANSARIDEQGRVHLEALDTLMITADGASGGEVLVGGDFQGNNPEIVNAESSYIGPEVTLSADALGVGDGGKVIVWADGFTRYYGDISATGGQEAGDGGLVEVSGLQQLDFDGMADVAAPKGSAGTILLDPTMFQVVGLGANDGEVSDGTVLFGDGGFASFSVSANALQALTGNISIQATQNVQFGSPLVLGNQTSGEMFSVEAGGNIIVSAPITTAGADIFLSAGDPDSGMAIPNAMINIGAAINTTMAGGNGNVGLTTNLAAGGVVQVSAPITLGTGVLDLNSGSLIEIFSTINGGQLRASGVAEPQFRPGAILNGVILDTDATILNGLSLTIQNGLTLGGGTVATPTLTLASTGNTTSLSFSGAGPTE
jgi:filamentous hemagglutinin family protein